MLRRNLRGDELEINSLRLLRFPGCVLYKISINNKKEQNKNMDVFDSSRVEKEATSAFFVCWKIRNNGAGGQNQLCPLLA